VVNGKTAAPAIGDATEPSRSRGVSLLPNSSPLPPQIPPSHPNTRRPRQVGFGGGWVWGVGWEAAIVSCRREATERRAVRSGPSPAEAEDGVPPGEAPAVVREHVRVLPGAAPELAPPRQAVQEAARRDIPQDACEYRAALFLGSVSSARV
jgi:hypothetical protein